MIQRIQSIYLLIVVILSSITLFLPWASFSSASYWEFGYNGLWEFFQSDKTMMFEKSKQIFSPPYALTAIAAIVPVVALVSIFLYKKRILQIRVSIFNILLMCGFYVLLAVYCFTMPDYMKTPQPQFVTAFPLVCMILTYLAIRAIKKDEELVRSLDRLR